MVAAELRTLRGFIQAVTRLATKSTSLFTMTSCAATSRSQAFISVCAAS